MSDATAIPDQPAPRATPKARVLRAIEWSALLGAILAVTLLGVRVIANFDMGYHLAYGDTFLQTHRPVETSPHVYPVSPAGVAQASELGELPPGAWRDAEGTLHFPNANWLTQVIFAQVHAIGGMEGLCLLRAAMVLGIVLLCVSTMRLLGATPLPTALILLLIGLCAYPRFSLRPELCGYLILAMQLRLLSPHLRREAAPLTVTTVALLVALQCALVNLHSYWLLGMAITGAIWIGLGAPCLWRKWFSRREAKQNAPAQPLRRLTLLLALQLGACFVNPWGYRLVLLPLQTLWFFHIHDVTATNATHPWGVIGEFFSPLHTIFRALLVTWVFYVVLSVAALAAGVAILRRQWAALFLIVGFVAMSLGMQRNIAPGAILLLPIAAGLFAGAWRAWVSPRWTLPQAASLILAVVTLAAAGTLAWGVVSNQWYYRQRQANRFGLGVSRMTLPLDAGEYLSNHRIAGRIWCDYDTSSNLYHATQPHPTLPILTNTWAYPPETMNRVLTISEARAPYTYDQTFLPLDVQAVVLRNVKLSAGLITQLAMDPQGRPHPDWAVAHLDAMYIVFVRKGKAGKNPHLVKRALTPESLPAATLIKKLRQQDPIPGFALHAGGILLQRIGWDSHAIAVLTEAAKEDPTRHETWYELGACYALRGQARNKRRDRAGAIADLQQAEKHLRRCIELDPDFQNAKAFRQALQNDLRILQSIP